MHNKTKNPVFSLHISRYPIESFMGKSATFVKKLYEMEKDEIITVLIITVLTLPLVEGLKIMLTIDLWVLYQYR